MLLNQLSINQATAETSSTPEVLRACQAAGIGQVSLWRHKYLGGRAGETATAVGDHGLRVSSLCRGGFFTGTRTAAQAAEDNLRAVAEAVELGTSILVLVCGPVVDGDTAAAQAGIARGIEHLLPAAVDAGITLAIEPFHPMLIAERSAIVTLAQASRLVEQFADPHLAIALDTYHVWWDPDLAAGLERAGGTIAALHVADWLVPTTDPLAGRGLPGDGVIELAALLAAVERTGFTGPVEVEVLNPEVWARPVGRVAVDVRDRMAALFAEAVPVAVPQ